MCALIPKYPDLAIDTICEHYHTMPATVQERAGMIDSISTTAKLFVQTHSAFLCKGTAHKAQRTMTFGCNKGAGDDSKS